MEKLSREEVLHVASLGKLWLSEEEIEKFSYQLRSLLDYIDKINKVTITDCEGLIAPYTNDCVLRKDEVETFENADSLIENAPKTFDKFIEVAGVFDE